MAAYRAGHEWDKAQQQHGVKPSRPDKRVVESKEEIMTTKRTPSAERLSDAGLQVFDLSETAAQLHAEGMGATNRNAITLRNAPGLRVVLLAMQAGDRLHDHHAPGPITLHTITGRVRFTTTDQAVELEAQMMVALEGGITHAVEALEESVCVLIIGSAP
jgi:quercetin dioxygenase-like cupin family protein